MTVPVAGQSCSGDFDRDGTVGSADLTQLLDAWGQCPTCGPDLDGDGIVGAADLGTLLERMGPCAGGEPDPEGTDRDFWLHDDGTVRFEGRKYASWEEYLERVDPLVWRCGSELRKPLVGGGPVEGGIASSAADCDWNVTVPRLEYLPGPALCITVVVHILRNDSGTLGHVPAERIRGQIEVLNARFAAAKIRFRLATLDPTGHPTPGFVYHDNTTWFNDSGDYWTQLAWDTSRYLNIYTGTADGALGYAFAPYTAAACQGTPLNRCGIGTDSDRVVINHLYFGPNPAAAPYDQGLTCVHEVGHYLGLHHTFAQLEDMNGDGIAETFLEPPTGCTAGSCYGSGDLLCDTGRSHDAHEGCNATVATCGDGPDPVRNYMDYSHDSCMNGFSREQIGRMRCTLLTRRATLPGECAVGGDIDGDGLVGSSDLSALLAAWGTAGAADLNGDGEVDAADLPLLLSQWTYAPLPPRTVPGWATLVEAEPDPAVVTNAPMREAILATGLAWRVLDAGTGIELLLVPPGTFEMGCSPLISWDSCDQEGSGYIPVRSVTLTAPFYIGRYEVTQGQWTERMGSNPSFFDGGEHGGGPNRPVEQVSWTMVAGFTASTGLRLPTEAEWEYACRAGTNTSFHSMPGFPEGTNDPAHVGAIAWCEPNNGQCQKSGFCPPDWGTKDVGLKAANGLGLHDMSGNVEEWVNDFYDFSYYSWGPPINPTGPTTGNGHVIRSHFFSSWSHWTGSWVRGGEVPQHMSLGLGFRVARSP